MAYKYITENNLYHKQAYRYSEYEGTSFLRSYLVSRQQFLNANSEMEKEECVAECSEKMMNLSDVMQDLLNIRKALKSGKLDFEVIGLINAYVKSFEVRKRIYDKYDSTWKPVEDAGFENYMAYLLLSECLVLSYQYTEGLKYFSCLLKVDDVLLSIQDKLDIELKKYLCQLLRREITFFEQLTTEWGIDLEEQV